MDPQRSVRVVDRRQRRGLDFLSRRAVVAALEQEYVRRLGIAIGHPGDRARFFTAGLLLGGDVFTQLLLAGVDRLELGFLLILRLRFVTLLDHDVVDGEAARAAILKSKTAGR